MKTEKELRRWLTSRLRGKRILLQSIESGGTGLGVPDMYMKVHGADPCWLELKVAKVRLKGQVCLRWEPGQLNWINVHASVGGRTLLLALIEPEMLMIVEHPNIKKSYASIPLMLEASSYSLYIPFTNGNNLTTIFMDILS